MKVTVTGPESSGTSLVSRIFRSAGADVYHRSATYRNEWMMLAPLADACDVMIVVYRDPVATMKSQQAEGLSRYEAEAKLRSGYYEIACAIRLVSVPVYCLTYEQLVLDPDSIRPLLALLNLDADADIEEVINENVKYREYQ